MNSIQWISTKCGQRKFRKFCGRHIWMTAPNGSDDRLGTLRHNELHAVADTNVLRADLLLRGKQEHLPHLPDIHVLLGVFPLLRASGVHAASSGEMPARSKYWGDHLYKVVQLVGKLGSFIQG